MAFQMPPIETYFDRHGDTLETRIAYYQTYLTHTDYVAAKLAEAAYIGEKLGENYSKIIDCRKAARKRINELREKIGKKEVNGQATSN